MASNRHNKHKSWRSSNPQPDGTGDQKQSHDHHRPCRHFLLGKCHYGSKCKFSHEQIASDDGDKPEASGPQKSKKPLIIQQDREKYNQWKRHLKSPPNKYEQYRIDQLWKGALQILNSDDRESKQMLAQDMVSQNLQGLQHIQYLMGLNRIDIDATNSAALKDFLLVVTHEDLLHSLAIDTYVGEVYNRIRGSNGNRIMAFLANLFEALATSTIWSQYDEGIVIGAACNLLRSTLRKETIVRFHEHLTERLDQLARLADSLVTDSSEIRHVLFRQILEMRAMTAKAEDTECDSPTGHPSKHRAISTYNLAIKLPGGRHDNDRPNIDEIVIFPTDSEIKSDQAEYIPFADRDGPHHLVDRAARHIDTQFRLLRHDTFKELKEALGRLHFAQKYTAASGALNHLDLGDIRANQYGNAYIEDITFEARSGLQFHISFPRPHVPALRLRSEAEISDWWNESKRLSEGSLVCLITINGAEIDYVFFVVSKKPQQYDDSRTGSARQHRRMTVTAELANLCEADVGKAVLLSCEGTTGLLIEFPGIIPATFKPILENLQIMQKDRRLPFVDWVLPTVSKSSAEQTLSVPPPLYARGAGFSFSLQSITKATRTEVTVQPRELGSIEKISSVRENTGLDQGQSAALIAALSREFAFIQGPPGTGKSYLGVQLMKVLLDHKEKAQLGPVVVVCYTNHALDQFLEHLLTDGIAKIIRVGRQSKSEMLEHHNLSEVRRKELKTKTENWHIAMAYTSLEELATRIETNLNNLRGALGKKDPWGHIKQYLTRSHPHIANQFGRFDEDGFQIVGDHPFNRWAKKRDDISNSFAAPLDMLLRKATENVHTLIGNERSALLNFWMQEIQAEALSSLFENVMEASSKHKLLTNTYDEASRRVLEGCDVIGITTTGLAKNMSLLQHIQAKVVICEEAGEVMEPHMICTLLPAVQHLIQIGDHQQLRPQINTYSLSLESDEGTSYQLDRSQFERLCVGEPNRTKMPFVQLSQQRRMRPEISKLIRQTVYPSLVDHPSTLDKDDVVGMRSNLFWLDHKYPESSPDKELFHKSHSNKHEIELVHALVRHIIRQGVYKSSDIAVLTPYTGQLSGLRRALRDDFEIVLNDRDQDALDLQDSGVETVANPEGAHLAGITSFAKKKLIELLRIATVDNFQGEEAKVVIISLVRSNDNKKVGFLRTINRINVLLSRAQHGMYLIGNADTYSNVNMWQQVIEMLKANGNIGETIGLCCPRHKNIPIEAKEPEDFARLSPEGGCQLACDRRLDCGHKCYSRCHADTMHKVVNCSEPCQRLHEACQHACQKATCGEPCGLCQIIIHDVQLPCGHVQDILCHQVQDISNVPCQTSIERIVPGCLHLVSVSCGTDVSAATFECPYDCTETLPCGHLCPGKCGQCRANGGGAEELRPHHQSCAKICKKQQGSCEHLCREFCHAGAPCSPCKQPCEVRCQHSQCKQLCFEPCAPCIEPCTWHCAHRGVCNMPCGAPCDRLPCNERCEKLLPCGHQCPGLCGETCSADYCQECGHRLDARVDLLELRTYGEIDLVEDRIVTLSCGHFFTTESLDRMIGMHDLYIMDAAGNFTEIKDLPSRFASGIPSCPDCKCPIRQHAGHRYGRLLNQSIVDNMTKRFIIQGQIDLASWTTKLAETATILESVDQAIKQRDAKMIGGDPILNIRIRHRLASITKLNTDINRFVGKVAAHNQPAQKIHQAIIHAQRRLVDQAIEAKFVALKLESRSPSDPTKSILFGAMLLQTRSKEIMLQGYHLFAEMTEHEGLLHKICGQSRTSIVSSILSLVDDYQAIVNSCLDAQLYKLAIRGILSLAHAALSCRESPVLQVDKERVAANDNIAKAFIKHAHDLCLDGQENLEDLIPAVEIMLQKFGTDPRYEEVTEQEIAAIKAAMLNGPDSLRSHAGHWFRCANGHLFAIGECGMPMELARCSECNAPIGGRNHTAVDGVSRAVEME